MPLLSSPGRVSLSVCLLFGVLVGTGSSQTIHGTIAGRVLDPSGAAIANARVTVIDTATASASTAVTDPSGVYRFPRLAPGRYHVVVEKTGFRQHVQDLVLTVNEQLLLDAVLAIGAVEDRVVVEARPALVQARSAEISGLVDEKRVRELPLNGGNFQRLSLLAPGASGGGSTSTSRTRKPKCRRTVGPTHASRAPASLPTPRPPPTTPFNWSAATDSLGAWI